MRMKKLDIAGLFDEVLNFDPAYPVMTNHGYDFSEFEMQRLKNEPGSDYIRDVWDRINDDSSTMADE
jgi:hypothetical protein